MKQVASVIDTFIGAGLLNRTQNPSHAARMYFLRLNGPEGAGLTDLLKLASTTPGRGSILQIFGSVRFNGRSAPAKDHSKEQRRLHPISRPSN